MAVILIPSYPGNFTYTYHMIKDTRSWKVYACVYQLCVKELSLREKTHVTCVLRACGQPSLCSVVRELCALSCSVFFLKLLCVMQRPWFDMKPKKKSRLRQHFFLDLVETLVLQDAR